MAHGYDKTFYDYIERGARESARAVLTELSKAMRVHSVLDVGCGRGAWLAEWRAAGVADFAGIDGPYVDRDRLLVAADRFHVADVSVAFDLGRRFDLVQCLEVGEHIAPERSATLIANLVRHGDVIMFSAATPGQGGEHHVNERPLAFWRGLFGSHGYAVYDYLRPRLRDRRGVEPWYRYNTLLYANTAGAARLTPAIVASRLADETPIAAIAPLAWRLRCALLRNLSPAQITRLAELKHRLALARGR